MNSFQDLLMYFLLFLNWPLHFFIYCCINWFMFTLYYTNTCGCHCDCLEVSSAWTNYLSCIMEFVIITCGTWKRYYNTIIVAIYWTWWGGIWRICSTWGLSSWTLWLVAIWITTYCLLWIGIIVIISLCKNLIVSNCHNWNFIILNGVVFLELFLHWRGYHVTD